MSSDAFSRSLRLLHRIAASAVQQTVIAPGGAVGQVPLLHQDGIQPPHGQIADDAGAGSPAADHQYLCFNLSHVVVSLWNEMFCVHASGKGADALPIREAKDAADAGLSPLQMA